MIEIKAYKCVCGKKYYSKKGAIEHEKVCRCWTNPIHKTCMTCKFGKLVSDSNGMEDDPAFLQKWKYWQCSNPAFNSELHFTPAHEKVSDLCINCPVWLNKQNDNGK